MKKIILLLIVFLSPKSFSAEFHNGMGMGIQYGGLLGWQGSLIQEDLRLRAALGLFGASLGADKMVNQKVSLGATVGTIVLAEGAALNLNIYPNGRFAKGMCLGIDVGMGRAGLSKDKTSGSFTFVSIGYTFGD